MTLTIKFNVGDRLVPILFYNGEWHVHPPFDCNRIGYDGHEITYAFMTTYGFPECDVFASKAEAEAAVIERNYNFPAGSLKPAGSLSR
jgi:hypothetical protein